MDRKKSNNKKDIYFPSILLDSFSFRYSILKSSVKFQPPHCLLSNG